MTKENGPRLTRQAACTYLKEQWGIERKPATLAKLACVGGGPSYELVNRKPLYPPIELDKWAQSLIKPMRKSTSAQVDDRPGL